MRKKKVPLFYWSSRVFENQPLENYGDLISYYLVQKLSNREVKWIHPKKQPWYRFNRLHYVVVGSILHHCTSESIVWGAGIIDQTHPVEAAEFLAVRGPQTRKYLLEQGYSCPKIFGDPAILMPLFYNPEITKKYRLGIIPHYRDFKVAKENFKFNKDVVVIDLMTLDVEEVTAQILQCERTISSSLHGLIVSHTYGIPSVWVKFSENLFGNGVKFWDYLESVELDVYKPKWFETGMDGIEEIFDKFPNLPARKKIKELSDALMECNPF